MFIFCVYLKDKRIININKIMFKIHLKFLIIKHRFQSKFNEQLVISIIIIIFGLNI